MITAKTKICLIIGDPVEHSLSPQMHNSAYKALGIDNKFVFLAANVKKENIKIILEAVKAMNIRGLTCTIPHKVEVMKFLSMENIDPVAKKIGAINTVVNNNGILKGYNTDWLGILAPLEKITSLENKNVAILGAGGAARAMVYAVTTKGASFTVYNRTLDKAEALAKEFGGAGKSLNDIPEITTSDIILNATPLGMEPNINETPLEKKYINNKHIVFDATYAPYETRLIKEAKEQGAKVIHGLEMLLYQALSQFEIYTKQKAPEDVMRQVLLDSIASN